jgi:hypothetical protein
MVIVVVLEKLRPVAGRVERPLPGKAAVQVTDFACPVSQNQYCAP